jgi:hypothetical protein
MISAVPRGSMLDFVGVRAIVHDLVIRTVSISARWGAAV